jgi:hypothetical protein
MLPLGLITFACEIACTISSGEKPSARIRSGFTFTAMVRAAPPNGGGADTPGSVAKSGRTMFSAASCICPTVRVGFSVEKTRCPTATLPASKRMMNGDTVPGGIKARARLTYCTVSAIAWLMSVPGWNCSFMSEAPWIDFDSTCSMPVM